MKTERRSIAPEVLLEEYRALLEEEKVEALPLLVTGGSMSPFLIGGRDTVFLSRLDRPARRGDILLYRRDNGGYVLHRVYRAEAEVLTMVGDAQRILEPGIREDQVIALVTKAERKGKLLSPGCFWWDFFEKVWIRMIPLRRLIWKGYSLFHRAFVGRK